ncbi:MAG: hypothetical protein Q611_LSC00410G0002 [Leuconostoc sp. DORA_2]|nr:MAG: hypothetical protein Q611_LSC00410G0002 [Leuconostoc sp. DORA_2]
MMPDAVCVTLGTKWKRAKISLLITPAKPAPMLAPMAETDVSKPWARTPKRHSP